MSADPACRTKDAAHVLRKRGFALCKPDPGTKSPTAKGWPVRSLEPRDFRDDDMLGIMGGPLSDGGQRDHALIIIDLDAPQAVKRADDYLPATAMVEGRASKRRSHRYYLVPFDSIPEWAESTADQGSKAAREATGHPGPFVKPFGNCETKAEVLKLIGTGGQCVAPPSTWVSKDGTRSERREWEGGAPGEAAVVPFLQLWGDVCELANACGAKIPDAMPRQPGPRPRTAGLWERALDYFKKVQPAISGQNGHAAMFWAARVLVQGFCFSPEDAFQFLIAEYNPRCEPPFNEKEIRHKIDNADRCPFKKPRGWLLETREPIPTPNGKPSTNGKHSTHDPKPDTPKPTPEDSEPPTGTRLILAYFQQRYRPAFRRGNAIVCTDGTDVPMNVACAVPDSKLIDQLAGASDAPLYKGGGLNRNALPGFFKSWAKVAWGDLLSELPDEDTAELGTNSPARDEFRRLVREAMFTEITLADRDEREVERRSLIDWCHKFAKPGPWRTIRSKKCWCKIVRKADGELVVKVAIRHELFSQLKADRRLCEMGLNTFTRRAERYEVGQSTRDDRPHGQSAIVFDTGFVADLLVGLHDRDDEDAPLEG